MCVNFWIVLFLNVDFVQFESKQKKSALFNVFSSMLELINQKEKGRTHKRLPSRQIHIDSHFRLIHVQLKFSLSWITWVCNLIAFYEQIVLMVDSMLCNRKCYIFIFYSNRKVTQRTTNSTEHCAKKNELCNLKFKAHNLLQLMNIVVWLCSVLLFKSNHFHLIRIMPLAKIIWIA